MTTLDLDTLDRSFTLRCHDALVDALAPPLIQAVAEAAPGPRSAPRSPPPPWAPTAWSR